MNNQANINDVALKEVKKILDTLNPQNFKVKTLIETNVTKTELGDMDCHILALSIYENSIIDNVIQVGGSNLLSFVESIKSELDSYIDLKGLRYNEDNNDDTTLIQDLDDDIIAITTKSKTKKINTMVINKNFASAVTTIYDIALKSKGVYNFSIADELCSAEFSLNDKSKALKLSSTYSFKDGEEVSEGLDIRVYDKNITENIISNLKIFLKN